MQYPQVPLLPPKIRELITDDLDALAHYHANRNRCYVQLESGKLRVQIQEVLLGKVHVFKEEINIGARIEATPDSSIVPFAYILSPSSTYSFCGQHGEGNSFIQASGGVWDINFKGKLEYVSCAFNKDYFFSSYELIKGRDVPKQHLVSQLNSPLGSAEKQYALSVNKILEWVKKNSFIYLYPQVLQLLSSQIFQLTLDALPSASAPSKEAFRQHSKRIQGTKRVIEYLQEHAKELPDMQTICKVAKISERSLQYGFIDCLGITPIQYLRIIRLNGARSDLLKSHSTRTKVVEVAITWGFLEFGRFSKEYKQLFHELPSQSLKRY